MRGEFGREWTHTHEWLSPSTVHLKLSQHCLLLGYTPTQNKSFLKKLHDVPLKRFITNMQPILYGWAFPSEVIIDDTEINGLVNTKIFSKNS